MRQRVYFSSIFKCSTVIDSRTHDLESSHDKHPVLQFGESSLATPHPLKQNKQKQKNPHQKQGKDYILSHP